MRRSERRHLKQNMVALAITNIQEQTREWGRALMIALAIGIGALVLFAGYSWWSGRTASQAGALLAEALVLADAPVVPPPPPPPPDVPPATADDTAEPTDSAVPATIVPPVEFVQPLGTFPTIEARGSAALPKLIEAADAYPRSQAGITARYRAAAALAALERHDEAAELYRQVIDLDEGGVYGRMATLGLAEMQIARGAYEEGIGLLEQSSGPGAGADLPVDGVLMRLGQAYALAGRPGEARATFQRVMDEFPASFYFADAERELEALQTQG